MPFEKKVWEAKDGTTHKTRDLAVAYEELLDIYDYVDRNPIFCGSSEAKVDGQAIGLWLKDNPSIYMKYLHGGECPQGQEDVDGD